ncbi:MAG: FtsW/RodA/SpoVE family cell cycle protein, partial [Lachnospiraceae bacterium]|nr:FtsW/RodA/SpoVE family cell cycle protein [Lachnospiraceae bacterium]
MFEQLYKGCYKLGWNIKQLFLDAKRSFVFYIVALQLASILIVSGKGAGQIYLDMFLILLGITLVTYFLVKVQHGNMKIAVYTIVLLTIGTMLQSIFREEAVLADPEAWTLKNPAATLQIQYLIAMAGAIAAGFFYKKGKFLAKPKVIKVMFGVSIGIYLVTLILAQAVGNVKNWLVIGGFSIQTSEINKLLYLFIMAGILGGVKNPSKKRVGFAFFVTITNLLFLTLQSEFGTMLLILLVFPVYLLLFVPDVRVVLVTVAGFIGAGIGAAFVGNFIKAQAAAHQAFGQLGFIQLFLSNYNKIANRFIYWLNPEKDPLGLGYQMLQAKNAIILGGLFGTNSVTNLPVKTSDMVFPALIERCGIIIAVLVLIVIIMLWLEGIRVFIRKKDRYHQAVCAGIVFMLFYQALIIVAGSCGMCPLTGITLPFISSGGSSLLVSAVMIAIIITISGNVEWEGEMDHEEMELEFKFFTKDTDHPKHFASVCHRYGAVLNQNLRSLTG